MAPYLQPHFFIIGERKCGTSSLYRYLLEHPQVLPGPRKEMQFFSQPSEYVEKHFPEYLRAFPSAFKGGSAVLDWPELDPSGKLYSETIRFQREATRTYVTGEASADTFCNVSPALLSQFLPKLRLLLLLRDPVERAFSHHRMFTRFQQEGRNLGFVVEDFARDMHQEMQRVRNGETTPCISPGLYIQRLREWHEIWGSSQLLVLFSRDLSEPESCKTLMCRVLSYLDLADHNYGDTLHNRYNRAPHAVIPTDIKAELSAFYRPYSEALQEHLQTPLPWPLARSYPNHNAGDCSSRQQSRQ